MSIGKAQSIEELLDIAFNNSPILKSQYHRMNAAKESYKKESIFKNNPVLSFSYSNVPLSDWPSLNKHAMSGFSIGISQYIATPWCIFLLNLPPIPVDHPPRKWTPNQTIFLSSKSTGLI